MLSLKSSRPVRPAAATLVFFCWMLTTVTPNQAVSSPHLSAEELRAIRFRCAPNCLYLLLCAYGVACDFDQVVRELPVGEGGASMLELRDAADRLGLPCEIHRLDLDTAQLAQCRLPVVAYFTASYHGNRTGHFVLVYDVVSEGDRKGVWFIDSTDGKQVRYPWERFPVKWSGHVLMPKHSAVLSGFLPIAANVVFWLLAGLIWWRWCHRQVPVAHGADAAVTSALVAIFLMAITGSATAETIRTPDAKIWRTAERDGVNCLYLLLRLHGHAVRYDELESTVTPGSRQVSLLTLMEVARDFDLPFTPKRCSPSDLAKLPSPMIAHINDVRHGGGRFILVYNVPQNANGKFGVIEAGTAKLNELSVDRFRRSWSGLVLIRDRQALSWQLVWAVNLFVLGGYSWWRSRSIPVRSRMQSAE